MQWHRAVFCATNIYEQGCSFTFLVLKVASVYSTNSALMYVRPMRVELAVTATSASSPNGCVVPEHDSPLSGA